MNHISGTVSLLKLDEDVVQVAQDLCSIASVSGNERSIADVVEATLMQYSHLEVLRDGDAVVARTNLGKDKRVIVAGHLDTVPIVDNVPARRELRQDEEVLWGRGSVDMKSGVATHLSCAAQLRETKCDVTWVFYDHEEVASSLNGLGRLVRNHPEWLVGDLAILGEPTNGEIEGGCNGTLRVEIATKGITAHSARSWLGDNAIHRVGDVLQRLNQYEPATVRVDGLDYREGMNAVWIEGGIATNVIPDACSVLVNYRFAPDKTVAQALAKVQEVFAGLEISIEIRDEADGARPGLDNPLVQDFAQSVMAITGGIPGPKYGWTDVARFSALGIPAVNFGPGDPALCHTDDENCPVQQIRDCTNALRRFLL